MSAKKTYVIKLAGMVSREQQILKTICSISKNRPHAYVLQNVTSSSQADIAIVNKDNPIAYAAWKRYQARYPTLPVIMLTGQPESNPSGYQLGRPLMATRLLKLLDEILRPDEAPAFTAPQAGENRAVSHVKQATATQRTTPGAEGQKAQLAALVVDDSLPVRRQLGLNLAPLVDRVDMAEDGEKAVEFIANRFYDIIFLDVVLPGMDGYKICREIKRNKSTKSTPVVMLTGKSSPFDKVKGKLAGCDTYLTKPVDGSTFKKVVQKYVAKTA